MLSSILESYAMYVIIHMKIKVKTYVQIDCKNNNITHSVRQLSMYTCLNKTK